MINFFKFAFATLFIIGLQTSFSYAQNTSGAIPPTYDGSFTVIEADETDPAYQRVYKDAPSHPALKLTPDKSEIIRLDDKIKTVIVGNPQHLAVLPSTSQGLILVGKLPGATHFIALNDKDEIVMQRHVIVAAPKNNYVRIRKSCANVESEACQPTQVYYCPDACHETLVNQPTEQTEAPDALSSGSNDLGDTAVPAAQAAVDAASE
jgi:hypothetical protein